MGAGTGELCIEDAVLPLTGLLFSTYGLFEKPRYWWLPAEVRVASSRHQNEFRAR